MEFVGKIFHYRGCEILVLSMNLFGTLRSMLAQIMCCSKSCLGVFLYLGFGCTTNGLHHVIASPSGTFSMISCATQSSNHFLSGSHRKYGWYLSGFLCLWCHTWSHVEVGVYFLLALLVFSFPNFRKKHACIGPLCLLLM